MIGESRKNLAETFARILPGSDCRQFHSRMPEQKSHEFLARVPGSADNRNFCFHIRHAQKEKPRRNWPAGLKISRTN